MPARKHCSPSSFRDRAVKAMTGTWPPAALLLGIARRTLRVKLQDLGLQVAHSVEADEDNTP